MLMQRVKPLARILAEGSDEKGGLKRSLGPWALTAMGIGAIIGTGIFVLTGVASATRAGPSLTLSFVIAGVVSALAALCYAEVSSKIPISGSAYTYTYATLWRVSRVDRRLGIGAGVRFGRGNGQRWMVGLFYVHPAHALQLQHSSSVAAQPLGRHAWNRNLPAAGIIFLITALLVRGTKESGSVNGVIVAIKVAVVLFFIAIGIGHINSANYHLPPGVSAGEGGYFPFGWPACLGARRSFSCLHWLRRGVDDGRRSQESVSDLPFGIIASLVICTILYIVVVAILNGIVPFYTLNVNFPVAFAVDSIGLAWPA